MSGSELGLIEMFSVFALALAFGFWELYALKRDKRRKPPDDGAQSGGKGVNEKRPPEG